MANPNFGGSQPAPEWMKTAEQRIKEKKETQKPYSVEIYAVHDKETGQTGFVWEGAFPQNSTPAGTYSTNIDVIAQEVSANYRAGKEKDSELKSKFELKFSVPQPDKSKEGARALTAAEQQEFMDALTRANQEAGKQQKP
ncbi:MAG: hypothetical protein P4L79_07775 [Legionella sp.]|uniref:hypothetical protein n=1 Tax=Legionella sp. TaxID=459 RepID=UPI0028466612|nr:hypothetical protein [Legionella sp.]